MACFFGGEQGLQHGVIRRGARDDARAVVLDVDFDKNQRLDDGAPGLRADLGEQRDLSGVVDHDGDGIGSQGGGNGREAGHDGRVEREGVEDVDLAALGLEFLQERRDSLGFKDG